jgi:hypothetical protein
MENLIEVGAVVDFSQYKAGMQDMVTTTQTSCAKIETVFQGTAEEVEAAINSVMLPALKEIPPQVENIPAEFEKAAAGTHEAMAGMAFAVEDSGIKMSRHFRRLLAEIPMVNAAFTALMPVLALQVGFSILKDVTEKVSQLAADTFIYTEAEKNAEKAIAASNAELEKLAAHTKTVSRERQLAAAAGKGPGEEMKLKLKFAIEDQGDPEKLKQRMTEIKGQLADANAELEKARSKVDDWTLKSGKIWENFEVATEKVNNLNNEYVLLDARLKDIAQTTGQITDQGFKKMADAADKAAKEDEARHTKFVSMVYAERQAMQDKAAAHETELAQETVAVFRETEKQNQEIIKTVNEQIRAYEIIQEAARAHEAALGQLADQRLNFELQIGKISQAAYEKQLQQQLAETYANERAKLEAKRQAAEGNVIEQAKVDAQLRQLDDKYLAESEKAEQQSYIRRRQKFDQYFQQIANTFNTEITSWVKGTETASQAFSKMFDSIIGDLAGFVEKWVEHKVEMWLMDRILGESAQTAQIAAHNAGNGVMAQSDAFLAAANALATVPFPENIPTSTEILGLGTGFAISAASFAVGTNYVPMDGLAMLHRGEKVIPASQQGPAFSGSGGDIHVHYSVSAVDAESFQSHIKRHSNMIGNEVARILKRRGGK